jgi:hypothetical protein
LNEKEFEFSVAKGGWESNKETAAARSAYELQAFQAAAVG